MTAHDGEAVYEMMRAFYSSPAVYTNGSDEIFRNDIAQCIGDNPYVEGYVFCNEEEIQGYGMVAKSYSTEFGKNCIWIEDIYVKPHWRGAGIGTGFLKFISEKYADCLIRLEVEQDNKYARRVYENCGFEALPYMEMKK
ncbi:MAG: GNAT family N-acetyltransferase [Clostridia bacterium]|nr:GNAT family N-acetyltransferase [Clostridia bacterium]